MPPGSGTAGAAAGTVTVIGRRAGAAGRVMGLRACLLATALRIPRLRHRASRHLSKRSMPGPGLPRGAQGLGRCRRSRGSLARLARHHRRSRYRSEGLRRQAGPCRFHGISLRLGATRRSFLRYARIRARWAILRARAAFHFRPARGPRRAKNRTGRLRLNRRQTRPEPPLIRLPVQNVPALIRRPAQSIPVRRPTHRSSRPYARPNPLRRTRFQVRRVRRNGFRALAFPPFGPPLPPLDRPLPRGGGAAPRRRQGRHEPRLVRRPLPGPVPAGPRRRPVRVRAPRRPVPGGRPEALRDRRKVPEPRRSPAKPPEPRREPAREARPRPRSPLRGAEPVLNAAPRRPPPGTRPCRERRNGEPGVRIFEPRRQLAVHAFEKPLLPFRSRFLLHGPQK